MQSVDNQFLYVELGQGRLGFILIILIAVESLRAAMVSSWRLDSLEDRAFAFAMLAALAVLWISLVTVYMGATVAADRLSPYRLGPIDRTRTYGPGCFRGSFHESPILFQTRIQLASLTALWGSIAKELIANQSTQKVL